MALRDSSCYTLTFQTNKANPAILDLNETYGAVFTRDEPRYVRVTEHREDEGYSLVIYDGLTTAKVASAGYTTEKAKRRRLQLHGPDEDVPFDFTGKINFEWSFEFEGNKFRWNRELYGKDYICSLDRKPDPRVEICLAREAGSKGPARLQILHYNIERFPDEIKDLRGLETLLVTSLVCLLDAANDRNGNGPSRSSSGGGKVIKDGPASASTSGITSTGTPPVPSHTERVISEDDFEPENPNEILVSMTSDIDDHIARATNLLMDPSILFVVIRTKMSEAVQRALEVSLGVTRFRHREGLPDLHQYVIEEEVFSTPPKPQPTPRPGPKVINLDDAPAHSSHSAAASASGSGAGTSPASDSGSKKWSSPPNIAVYLSTIELPDLKPGRREALSHTRSADAAGGAGGVRTSKPFPSGMAGSSSGQHKPPLQSPPLALAPPPILPPKQEANADPGSSRRTSSFGKLFRRGSSH